MWINLPQFIVIRSTKNEIYSNICRSHINCNPLGFVLRFDAADFPRVAGFWLECNENDMSIDSTDLNRTRSVYRHIVCLRNRRSLFIVSFYIFRGWPELGFQLNGKSVTHRYFLPLLFHAYIDTHFCICKAVSLFYRIHNALKIRRYYWFCSSGKYVIWYNNTVLRPMKN